MENLSGSVSTNFARWDRGGIGARLVSANFTERFPKDVVDENKRRRSHHGTPRHRREALSGRYRGPGSRYRAPGCRYRAPGSRYRPPKCRYTSRRPVSQSTGYGCLTDSVVRDGRERSSLRPRRKSDFRAPNGRGSGDAGGPLFRSGKTAKCSPIRVMARRTPPAGFSARKLRVPRRRFFPVGGRVRAGAEREAAVGREGEKGKLVWKGVISCLS